jgi:hypothetical protein
MIFLLKVDNSIFTCKRFGQVMTLRKCANLSRLQVQSDVVREFSPHGDLGFNIELSGNKG